MTGYTLDLWRFDPKFNKVEEKADKQARTQKVVNPTPIQKNVEYRPLVISILAEETRQILPKKAKKPSKKAEIPLVNIANLEPKYKFEVLSALSYLNTNEAIIKYNDNVYLWKDRKSDLPPMVAIEVNKILENFTFIKINDKK